MAPNPINLQGLVDIHGPKPCKFIGFGDITRPHLEGRPPFVLYFRFQTLGAVLQCRDMTQLEAATSTAQYFMILVGGGLPRALEAPRPSFGLTCRASSKYCGGGSAGSRGRSWLFAVVENAGGAICCSS